jgi:hypothetical protein
MPKASLSERAQRYAWTTAQTEKDKWKNSDPRKGLWGAAGREGAWAPAAAEAQIAQGGQKFLPQFLCWRLDSPSLPPHPSPQRD